MPQRTHMQPVERVEAKLPGPDVHRAAREHCQGSLTVHQSAGNLPGRAVAADRKNGIVVFGGRLVRQPRGIPSANGLGNLHLPSGVAQRAYDAADERLDGHASGSRVVKQQRFAHGGIITEVGFEPIQRAWLSWPQGPAGILVNDFSVIFVLFACRSLSMQLR